MIISALLATVLFYPSVVKEGDNLLDGAKWSGMNPESGVREYSMSRGGPFSVRDDVWKVNTFQETYGYWTCSAEVRPDREYIAGKEGLREILFFSKKYPESGKETYH